MRFFSLFERGLNPFPEAPVPQLPRGFFAFMWTCSAGARAWLGALVCLTAGVGAFEGWLFSALGNVVDWLAKVPPARLWLQERAQLLEIPGILLASILLVGVQTLIR